MSQLSKIREHLESGKTITPIEALNLYGCFRLGARIFNLRQSGMDIRDIGKERYSEYKLFKKERFAQLDLEA